MTKILQKFGVFLLCYTILLLKLREVLLINDDEYLSTTAKNFFKFLKEESPQLLEFAKVVNKSEKYPFIEEPGTIVIVVPARNGFIIDELYIETRKEDILIVLGDITHFHVDFSKKDIEERILHAIKLVNDILNEQVVIVRKKSFLSLNEFFSVIELSKMKTEKRIKQIYSWKGTFDKTLKIQ